MAQPTDAPEPGAQAIDPSAEPLLRQAFEFWIDPEIARRREAGQITDGFEMLAAQVIFNADADQPEIRLNQEVRGVLHGRATRKIEKGEIVHSDDFSEYVDMELTQQDANAGHLTLLRRPEFWWIKFDFRYNAGRIVGIIAAAKEFLEAAVAALQKQHYRALVDNLHSAVELLAKGVLLTAPDKRLLASKSHGFVAARYNLQGKLGNVPRQYVQLLNTLARLRSSARYLDQDFSLGSDTAKKMLSTAHEMLEFVVERSPKRAPVSAPDLAGTPGAEPPRK